MGYWHNLDVPEVGQIRFDELRPTIQFQYFFVKNRFTIYNRARLENRLLFYENQNGVDYSARFRYMPKFIYALNSPVIRRKSFYLICFDEIFLTVNKHDLIDRNRANLGFGYCLTDDIIIECVYTNQQSFAYSNRTELTNALGITVSINNIGKIFSQR